MTEPPMEATNDGLPGLVPLFCPRCGGKMGQVETADFCLQCDFVETYP